MNRGNLEPPLRLSFDGGLWDVHSSPVMRISSLRRKNRLTGKPARRVVAILALAAVVVFGATWAKISRYDARALPSPHFSTSVKIARVLFLNGLGDEPQALIAANEILPGPDW